MIVAFFDAYLKAGLQVIPLYPNTKIPVGRSWQKDWDRDRSREYCKRFPNSNLGILLGPIVDVEGDTEEANTLIMDLVGSVPHPNYRSLKSTHHLFVNPDPKLTIFCHRGMEFRAHRHQSVLPPSSHESGSKYQWLKSTQFPVPAMPDNLLEYYLKHNSAKKPLLKPGHIRPWCSLCRQKKVIHRKRYVLEQQAFRMVGLAWQCHSCRKLDLRDACRKLRKMMRTWK